MTVLFRCLLMIHFSMKMSREFLYATLVTELWTFIYILFNNNNQAFRPKQVGVGTLCYSVFDKYFSVDEWIHKHNVLLFWQVKPVVHVFQVRWHLYWFEWVLWFTSRCYWYFYRMDCRTSIWYRTGLVRQWTHTGFLLIISLFWLFWFGCISFLWFYCA